jgi:hypothetical protein
VEGGEKNFQELHFLKKFENWKNAKIIILKNYKLWKY